MKNVSVATFSLPVVITSTLKEHFDSELKTGNTFKSSPTGILSGIMKSFPSS